MPAPGPALVIAIRAPIARSDLPGLCRRVCGLIESSVPEVVVCDVVSVDADGVAVDALARLQLGARRRGCVVRLRGASDELRELVQFVGLGEVL